MDGRTRLLVHPVAQIRVADPGPLGQVSDMTEIVFSYNIFL